MHSVDKSPTTELDAELACGRWAEGFASAYRIPWDTKETLNLKLYCGPCVLFGTPVWPYPVRAGSPS